MSSDTASSTVAEVPGADVREEPASVGRPEVTVQTVTMAVVLVAALIGAVAVWGLWPRTPENDSADAGFLRDMTVHHSQAVEMALIIRDRTEEQFLDALATDIVLTQQGQIGMMTGWLAEWDLSQTGDEPGRFMAWMGHPTDGLMPGMATSEEVQQLRDLPLDEAEVLFLRLMIRHHEAGVEMAEACLDRCDADVVRELARGVVRSQQGEIDAMNSMLEARSQAPEPPESPISGDHDEHDVTPGAG